MSRHELSAPEPPRAANVSRPASRKRSCRIRTRDALSWGVAREATRTPTPAGSARVASPPGSPHRGFSLPGFAVLTPGLSRGVRRTGRLGLRGRHPRPRPAALGARIPGSFAFPAWLSVPTSGNSGPVPWRVLTGKPQSECGGDRAGASAPVARTQPRSGPQTRRVGSLSLPHHRACRLGSHRGQRRPQEKTFSDKFLGRKE